LLKIGADPELFCFDKKSNNFISAHTFFPGTKENPFPVQDGALQLDGLAAELNIDPVTNSSDFVTVLESVINTAKKFLPEGVELVAKPSVVFNKEYYDKTIPEINKRLGCTPDFNAWAFGAQNEMPLIETPSLRAAGGHLHLGWTEGKDYETDQEHRTRCIEVVRQLDCCVGLQCLSWDTDDDRRKLYGKAGAMRFKSYGVEYRTPSNDWLSSQEKMKRVFELTKKAYDDMEKGIPYFILVDDNIEEIINTGNRKKAQEVLDAILKAS